MPPEPSTLESVSPWVAGSAWIVCAVLLSVFVLHRIRTHAASEDGWQPNYMEMSFVWAAASFLWWALAGGWMHDRMALLIASSITGISIGAVLGFVFTSYEDEAASVGKVRDWLLAGLAGLTVVEVASGAGNIGRVLAIFASEGTPPALHVANLTGYAVLGFFGSFVLRELRLNLLFAKKRAERKKLSEIIKEAKPEVQSAVQKRAVGAAAALAPDDADTPPETTIERARQVVEAAEAASVPLAELDPRQAIILAESYTNLGNYPKAITIFQNVLERHGFNADAVTGAAYAYERLHAYAHAAEIVARHRARLGPEADQWLGYYYLYDPARLRESIEHSRRYLQTKPEDSATMFNLACAHAQLFGRDRNADDREKALAYLGDALRRAPMWRIRAQELTGPDGDFYSLQDDAEFRTLLKEAESSDARRAISQVNAVVTDPAGVASSPADGADS